MASVGNISLFRTEFLDCLHNVLHDAHCKFSFVPILPFSLFFGVLLLLFPCSPSISLFPILFLSFIPLAPSVLPPFHLPLVFLDGTKWSRTDVSQGLRASAAQRNHRCVMARLRYV